MITPRPIKFRAWTGTEMVAVESLSRNAGCLIWYAPGHMGIADAWDHSMWTKDNPRPTLAELKPVMQFTGLVDKQGVEIYEGDIVDRSGKSSPVGDEPSVFIQENGLIIYDVARARFEVHIEEEEGYSRASLKDPIKEDDEDGAFTLLVLGNVFSNPDLLKS